MVLEELGDRLTPSITLSGGVLSVVGTESADSVFLFHPGLDKSLVTVIHQGGGVYETATFATSQIASVSVDLSGGDDCYCNITTATFDENVRGGDGNDFVIGGAGGGTLDGGAGNDWVSSGQHYGKTKNVFGGTGADVVSLGMGTDFVQADSSDTILGFGQYDWSGIDGFAVLPT